MGLFSPKDDTHRVAPIPERLKQIEKIAILTADKTEDTELFYPYYRLTEAGYTVDVITPKGGKLEAKHGIILNDTKSIVQVDPASYALLYIPGGKAPAELRKNEQILAFVKEFARSGKPIAAICHGAQVLITAGLVAGKQMACWPEVAKELEEAGGRFIDEALVVDGQFITARMPGDLHRHMAGVIDCLNGELAMGSRTERKQAAAV